MPGTRANTTNGTVAFFRTVTFIAIVGALNWGLIGLFNWNLVDAIFGGGTAETTSAASRVVYALVGLAGLASLFLLPRSFFLGRGMHGELGANRPV